MVRARARILLFISAYAAFVMAGDLGEPVPELTAADLGFTAWGSVPEKRRLELRKKAGWKWEFPNEPPAYRARQEMRQREILGLKARERHPPCSRARALSPLVTRALLAALPRAR